MTSLLEGVFVERSSPPARQAVEVCTVCFLSSYINKCGVCYCHHINKCDICYCHQKADAAESSAARIGYGRVFNGIA
ncbi:hypothetical protein MRB53_038980 [Persea americana]|nr:hypothetical protein MRB53_038980 [Persea americana]